MPFRLDKEGFPFRAKSSVRATPDTGALPALANLPAASDPGVFRSELVTSLAVGLDLAIDEPTALDRIGDVVSLGSCPQMLRVAAPWSVAGVQTELGSDQSVLLRDDAVCESGARVATRQDAIAFVVHRPRPDQAVVLPFQPPEHPVDDRLHGMSLPACSLHSEVMPCRSV